MNPGRIGDVLMWAAILLFMTATVLEWAEASPPTGSKVPATVWSEPAVVTIKDGVLPTPTDVRVQDCYDGTVLVSWALPFEVQGSIEGFVVLRESLLAIKEGKQVWGDAHRVYALESALRLATDQPGPGTFRYTVRCVREWRRDPANPESFDFSKDWPEHR